MFCERKRTAHRVALLMGALGMRVAELHGNLSQTQRLQALDDFRLKKVSASFSSYVPSPFCGSLS